MYPSHSHSIVELKHVSFAYPGQEEILSDINLSIHEGDYLGMIGPNGGGKTTLLKLILGLLKPTRGTITVFDTAISAFHQWKKIGYVSQQSTRFDAHFPITVREVVEMGRYAQVGVLHSLTKEDIKLVDEALYQAGIEKYQNHQLGSLSGGLQQRVFIAKALAGKPDIIFLDEPTVGVDIAAQETFYALMHTLNTDLKKTLILVSHDIEVIARETTELACVNKTLIYDNNPKEFLKHDGLKKLYGDSLTLLLHNH